MQVISFITALKSKEQVFIDFQLIKMCLNYETDMAVFWVCIVLSWRIVPGYGKNVLLPSSALKMGAVKCWYLPTRLRGVITQKITIWIFISIKIAQLHINCDRIVTANSWLNTDTKVELEFSSQQGQKLCSPHHPDQSWGTPSLLSSDAGESHPPPFFGGWWE